MSVSKHLFDLIKSLTPAEKRYFKVFAKRHVKGEENNYVLLFNAIDKQDVYEEAKLLKKFESHPLSRHFSSEKNYLYKLLLKAMNAYDLDKSVDAQIRELIGFITFFQKKRLFKQALKQLDKAKKLAYKYEQYLYIVQLLHIETNLVNYAHKIQFQERISTNKIEVEQAIRNFQRYHEYRQLYDEIFWKNNTTLYATTKEQKAYFQETLQSPLLRTPYSLKDFRTQKLYYQILQICYIQTHQNRESYQVANSIVELYESRSHFLKYELDNYLAMLKNVIISCYLLEDWETLYQLIQKLRAVKTQTFDQELAIFETTYNAELAYHQKLSNYDKIAVLLEIIEQKLKQYGNRIKQPYLLVWYYNMAGLYFSLNHFDKALTWLNRFFDIHKSGVREDTYNKAIYLNLILHWELKNYRLLESLIRSVANYVRQKTKNYTFEPIVLACFKKLLNLPLESQKTQEELLQSLFYELQQIEDVVEKRFLNTTVIIHWLYTKLST